MIFIIVIVGAVIFIAGYFTYGRLLEKWLGVDPSRPTPANTESDAIDYVPAKPAILIGHHFSSIAGAGPIVGPIIAAAAFGWLPPVLWIVLGALLIGGVQDFGSLVASLRHRARSVAEMAKKEISPLARFLFLIFVWLTLVYIIIVFVDLTAATFAHEPGVATSSFIYIVLAIGLGLTVYRARAKLGLASVIFVPLVFLGIWAGQYLPLVLPVADARMTWSVLLLVYCFAASVLPVWFLLQPRDYLSSFLLYACLLGGVVGVILSGGRLPSGVEPLPAVVALHDINLGWIFPALFITVACGAISGFHTIVASGTTAKQLSNERYARPIAYGSMLLEGILALLAISAVIIVGGAASKSQAPTLVFGQGIGYLFSAIGIPAALGTHFGALAVSTFLLTTLDTCTRLGRYVLEELLKLTRAKIASILLATFITLLLPLVLTQVTLRLPDGTPAPAWKVIWPVFGSTNQLLGALAMMAVAAWLRNTGRKRMFILIPMIFMFCVTLAALAQLCLRFGIASIVGFVATILFVLAVILLIEGIRQMLKPLPGRIVEGT
jgi:carbon starvation protein